MYKYKKNTFKHNLHGIDKTLEISLNFEYAVDNGKPVAGSTGVTVSWDFTKRNKKQIK